MKFAHTFTSFKTVFSFCKPWSGTNLLLVLHIEGGGGGLCQDYERVDIMEFLLLPLII